MHFGYQSDSATSRPFLNSYSPALAAEMIKRRLRQRGLPEHYSAHSFRAAGVTSFLENGGSLEVAQRIAGHADSRTEKLLVEDMERIRY